MRILFVSRGVLLGFLVSLLVYVSLCYADDKAVEVVGLGECADCKESNIKTSHAFSGLRVTIECKSNKGEHQTRGVGELDEDGKFKVNLPKEIIKDGKLKEECYAQLHSASAAPCPAHSGIEALKIIFQSKSDEKHTFGPSGKLKFSTALCTSAFLWPYYKYPPLPTLPPLPQHPWKKYLPPFKHFGHIYPLPPKYKVPFPPIYKKPFPPVPIYKKPLPPPVPVYTKPLPPPVPVYTKPLPPPVPIYKPKPPVYKPTPIPVYKPKPKPKPPVYKAPPVPVYKPKPKPPVYTHPPIPIYKKPLPPLPPVYTHPPIPIYKKPLPPLPPIYTKPLPPPVPIYKKPCPPIIPLPKLPPKDFHHPKIGYFSPLPPYVPTHP